MSLYGSPVIGFGPLFVSHEEVKAVQFIITIINIFEPQHGHVLQRAHDRMLLSNRRGQRCD